LDFDRNFVFDLDRDRLLTLLFLATLPPVAFVSCKLAVTFAVIDLISAAIVAFNSSVLPKFVASIYALFSNVSFIGLSDAIWYMHIYIKTLNYQ
jgi:hypothetical protein